MERSCWTLALAKTDSKRVQVTFDLFALWLQEWWQGEMLAEVFNVLIGREAWTIGRNLEQHAAGHAEVDRLEVEAIDHRSYAQADLRKVLAPLEVLFRIGRAEGNVMHAADT